MMSRRSKILKVVVPLAILLGGAGIMLGLVSSRPAPKKEVRKELGALVNTTIVTRGDRRVTVRATGTVKAAESITVIPQVSGRVTSKAPAFVAGGFFKEGERLFEIERIDYRLALEQAEAARARAEYDMAKIESQARVARGEWERLKSGGAEPNPLVLFEPQLKDARAALKSAEASVERARVDLERTVVKAPFNARVSSEEVDIGQYVRAGTPVAVLSGTDSAEISVPLPLDELRWIEIPGRGRGTGAKAKVVMTIGGSRFVWKGRVVRSLGEVGLKDRMEQVVVAVRNPYGRKGPKGHSLAVGAFVDVEIEGRRLKGVYTVPRRALRDASTVWTVDKENRLEIRKVETARIERDSVIITDGLFEGDVVVLTTLSGAADGMKLRPVVEDEGK